MEKKNERTEITVNRTTEGTVFEVVSGLLLVVMWILAFHFWLSAKQDVPTHFNIHGQPNGWGPPIMLLVIALMGTICVGLMLVSAYHPRRMVSGAVLMNNVRQVAYAVRMLRVVAIETAVLFITIVVSIGTTRQKLSSAMYIITLSTAVLIVLSNRYYTHKTWKSR